MKRSILKVLAGASLIAMGMGVATAATSTAIITATADVVDGTTLNASASTNLRFGTLTVQNVAGSANSVTIYANPATPAASTGVAISGTTGPAVVDIDVTQGRTVTLSDGGSGTYDLTLDGAAKGSNNFVVVDSLTFYNNTQDTPGASCVGNVSNVCQFNVGGTLHIPSDTAQGSYTGTVSVTATTA